MQRHVWPNAALGFTSLYDRESKRALWELALSSSFDYDERPLKAYFERMLEAFDGRHETPVISWERLAGNPHSGGYDADVIARRLKSVFGAPRILLIIREQRSMLVSTYKQYVREGGTASFESYVTQKPNVRFPVFRLSYFDYDRLIARYIETFGGKNVLVLPYEMFKADPLKFVGRICWFCAHPHVDVRLPATRENEALSALNAAMLRRINPFVTSDVLNGFSSLRIKGLWRIERRLRQAAEKLVPARIRARIEDKLVREAAAIVGTRYRESNRITSNLISMDLVQYGYDVQPPSEISEPDRRPSKAA